MFLVLRYEKHHAAAHGFLELLGMLKVKRVGRVAGDVVHGHSVHASGCFLSTLRVLEVGQPGEGGWLLVLLAPPHPPVNCLALLRRYRYVESSVENGRK